MMNNFQNIISEARKKSLSSVDILNLVDHKAKLILYPELSNYDHIDQVLQPFGVVILLYETKHHYGHWCALIKRNDNTVEHFDSYGYRPDDELDFIDSNFRDINNERYPHLTALLYNSGYVIEYNDKQLQQHKKDYNSCGRWTAMRIILRYISIEQFIELFKSDSVISSDDLVTLLTIFI
jgi:hypothetical protein